MQRATAAAKLPLGAKEQDKEENPDGEVTASADAAVEAVLIKRGWHINRRTQNGTKENTAAARRRAVTPVYCRFVHQITGSKKKKI